MKNISDLKKLIPYRTVWEHLYGEIPKNRKCKCPAHAENTPSFIIYDDGGHCFGCGVHLDHIALTMHKMGISCKEAIQYLVNTFLNGAYNTAEFQFKTEHPPPIVCHPSRKFVLYSYRTVLGFIFKSVEVYTHNIFKNGLPQNYQKYLEEIRGYDLNFLQKHEVFKDNFGFLEANYKEFVQSVKRSISQNIRETSGIFKENGNLAGIHSQTYNMFIAFWCIERGKILIESIRLRNTQYPLQGEKEIQLIARGIGKPRSFGFAGLKRAYDKHPTAVLNHCSELIVVFTEGTMDWIAAHEIVHKYKLIEGIRNEHIIILTSGGTGSTTDQHLKMIQNCKQLILAFDNDKSGNADFIRVESMAKNMGISVQKFEFRTDCKDLNDLLKFLKQGEKFNG